MRHTFKVYERLKREQQIDTLFRTGKAFSVFPVKVLYLITARTPESNSPALAAFTVPKKKVKLAVDRHRTRRQMKESWRLGKHLLYAAIPPQQQLHLFFIYTDAADADYNTINDAIGQLITRLIGAVKN